VEDRLMKMMASPDRFIRGERGGAADVDGDAKRGPPRRRGGCFSGLAGRTHHHSEM
jgi:hypothetical protein